MFIASPRRIIPGVVFAAAGRKLFGMVGSRSASTAFRKEGWICFGRSGATTSRRYDLRVPNGGVDRMETSARVSWVPIW